ASSTSSWATTWCGTRRPPGSELRAGRDLVGNLLADQIAEGHRRPDGRPWPRVATGRGTVRAVPRRVESGDRLAGQRREHTAGRIDAQSAACRDRTGVHRHRVEGTLLERPE